MLLEAIERRFEIREFTKEDRMENKTLTITKTLS
jgi:hypothetical protein